MSELRAEQPFAVRPLGIGEIFDRAITLCVRNVGLLATMVAIVVIPLTVARYFMARSQRATIVQVIDQIEHPGHVAHTAPYVTEMAFVVLALSVVLSPFAYVAIATAVDRMYRCQPVSWRQAYAVAFAHWGGILAALVFEIVLLLVAFLAGGMMWGIVLGLAIVTLRYAFVLGVVLSIVAAIGGIAVLLAGMLFYLASALAFAAIGAEGVKWSRGVFGGIGRIFNRREIGRATLMCLAFLVVEIGIAIVVGGADALLQTVLHQPFIAAVVSGALTLVTTAFVYVLCVVYYFDVRVRAEGFDMQSALDSLQTLPQT